MLVSTTAARSCGCSSTTDRGIYQTKTAGRGPPFLFVPSLRVSRGLRLLLLRPNPVEALDFERRAAGFFGDLAVLLHDEGAGGLIAIEAAEQLRRHAPVGALRAVFIEDVEKGEFAFGIGSGFLGHGGLVVDKGAAVK